MEPEDGQDGFHLAMPQPSANIIKSGSLIRIRSPALVDEVLQSRRWHGDIFQRGSVPCHNSLVNLGERHSLKRHTPSKNLVARHGETVDISRPLVMRSGLQIRNMKHFRRSPGRRPHHLCQSRQRLRFCYPEISQLR